MKSATKQFRITAAQMKFAPTIAGNLEKIRRAIQSAARKRVDAILFPECATTGYAFDYSSLRPKDIDRALDTVASLARKFRINVLIGSAAFSGRKLQNCLVVFDRKGRLVHRYAKCQLVESDKKYFEPGNAISLFKLDGIWATSIICHERRYPELVRLAVMAGAQIIFHPNAGMDALAVSRRKRGGRDGISVRAFENAVFYVFANSVGPQGGGKWSAGDSKIVSPDGSVLRLADNKNEALLVATLDLSKATRKYALDGLRHPRFLAPHWRKIVKSIVRSAAISGD